MADRQPRRSAAAERPATLREAEECDLNARLSEVRRLLQGSLSDEELGRHPLMRETGHP